MGKLVMIRHGQSDWNKRNLFTGWVDIPLSQEGIQEALAAGHLIANIPFDMIFVSALVRAQMTMYLAMSVHKGGKIPRVIHNPEKGHIGWDEIYSEEAKQHCIPVIEAWQLNERMYGALQGLNKDETRRKFGADQVQIWRRSYAVAPPEGESLEMNAKRTIPYFQEIILPYLLEGKNVLLVAHGNSMRSIVMFLDKLNEEQVVQLEIATGEPLVYVCQEGKLIKGKLDGHKRDLS